MFIAIDCLLAEGMQPEEIVLPLSINFIGIRKQCRHVSEENKSMSRIVLDKMHCFETYDAIKEERKKWLHLVITGCEPPAGSYVDKKSQNTVVSQDHPFFSKPINYQQPLATNSLVLDFP